MQTFTLPRKDFRQAKNFPGRDGNVFDVILQGSARLEKIPAPLFVLALALLAAIAARLQWAWAAALLGFFLSDWLQLALLPRFRRSFGPPKPPTLVLAVLRSLFALLPVWLSLPLQIAGSLLIVAGFWIEPQRLSLTRQSLSHPGFKPSHPLRLLHLSDLHIERITGREQALQRQIEQLQPDLILFSGDVLNLSYRTDPLAWQAARQVIAQWRAPLGVFLVSGSPAVDLPETTPEVLADLPVRWLQDERVAITFDGQTFDLIGLTCTHKPFEDAPRLAQLLPTGPERLTILLYHTPDLAPDAAEMGVDLQLSGHTHGGQVRLPLLGALFTGSLYGRSFDAGRYLLGKMTLYISRGIGLEGAGAPRVRFLCPPEIILWEIG